MGITADDAVESVAATETVSSLRHGAHRLGGTDLWSVATYGDDGSPLAGSLTLVGPDRRVWKFSSNPGIHDTDLVVRSLEALYRANITEAIDGDVLAVRLRSLTETMTEHVQALVKDAQAGVLRRPSARELP